MKSIGIVREGYSIWERRCPFTPCQVKQIVRMGITVYVQPSNKRIFCDRYYQEAGAHVTDDLSGANAIFGVKQVVKENLIPGKTYLFFSHTIKAQMENMALLDSLREKKIRFIDYECITRGGIAGNPRLVAFGEYAGIAGMINTLRGIGQQLLFKGISTPFLNVGSAYMYPNYINATTAVKRAGSEFYDSNINTAATTYNPLVFLFTGTGNVNRGARHVFQNMPHIWVSPEQFPDFVKNQIRCNDPGRVKNPIIGCQVEIQHMVERISDGGFDKKEFYTRPELYRTIFFDKYVRHCNVLVNGIFWNQKYPRIVSKEDLRKSATERGKTQESRMHFIADISCDPNGGIESLSAATTIDNPFMNVSDPREASDIMIMGVDILPSELPREASKHFGDYLLPFIETLASGTRTDDLPPELYGACITDRGVLCNRFAYIDQIRQENLRKQKQTVSVEHGSTTPKRFETPIYSGPIQTVVILGAGMVSKPCAELLSRDTSRNVILCSHIYEDAISIVKKIGRDNLQAMRIDVLKELEAIESLVKRSSVMVSLLPAIMHTEIAKLCIKYNVPLITASYVSKDMAALDKYAREMGVPILCEMGLDPGIDHMSAKMVIDEIKECGGYIDSFTSVCGGLTAPDVANNPFGYKFSWSPIGVINAMKNSACFIDHGKRIDVPGGVALMDSAKPFRMYQNPSLALEVLPNRDSLSYIDKYGIQKNTKQMFRGTLRYEGFAKIFAELIKSGMTGTNETFALAYKHFRTNTHSSHPSFHAVDWLLSDETLTNDQLNAPALETLATILTNKLALQPGERDLCLMQHSFNEGERVSTLLAYGDGFDTGMAKTVGFTVAIGARLFLDHSSPLKGNVRGILLPTEKRIYKPVLTQLEKENIIFQHHKCRSDYNIKINI